MTNLGKQQLNGTYEITPKILELAELCEKNNNIERELYTKYDVKRGLRLHLSLNIIVFLT